MPNQTLQIEDIHRNFDRTTVQRGQSYAASGRVDELTLDAGEHLYQARVQGSQSQPYQVDLRLLPGRNGIRLYGQCTCPMRVNCKHVAALAFTALQGDDLNVSPRPAPLTEKFSATSVPRQPRGSGAAVSSGSQLPFPLEAWLRNVNAASQASASGIEEYVPGVLHRLLYLLHPADPSIAPGLSVRLALARKLKAGGYSRATPWNGAHQALRAPPSFILKKDQRILRMLLLEAVRADGGDFPVDAEQAPAILREILATGRCHWLDVDRPALEEGPARKGRMQWFVLPTGAQQLMIETDPPSEAMLSISPPWYVDTQIDRCGPVETDLKPRLAAALAVSPCVPAESLQEFGRRFREHFDGLNLPAPVELEAVEIRTAPTPRLRLFTLQLWDVYRYRSRPLGDFLDVAALTFDYAGVQAGHDAPGTLLAYHGGKLQRMRRDHRLEKTARDQLTATGMIKVMNAAHSYPPPQKHDYTMLDEQRWLDFAVNTVPELRARGWIVDVDDSFRFQIAQIEAWSASIDERGSDWFDLSLGVQIDGQRFDLLPVLLSAMRLRGGKREAQRGTVEENMIVHLDDGRLLSVPMQRIAPILAILHELLENNAGDRLRLPRLDAIRLTDLEREAQLQLTGGEALRKFGARLADFSGIEAVSQPTALRAQLRPYQLQGVAWLQFLRQYELGGILADDMGLGKTVQTLAHLLLEKEAGRLTQPALVVTPTSVLPNWKNEAARFAPTLRVHVSHGVQRKHAFGQFAHADLVLTTYPLLARDKEALLAQQFHVVILDEAQQIKNAQTQAARLVGRLQASHRLCLTGTPLENNLGELWSLFHFLTPGLLGDSASFRRLYRTPVEKHGDELRRANLSRRIRPFLLRRTKEQVAPELPPKTEILQSVELDGAQRDLYETVRTTMHQRVRREIEARGLAQSQIVVLDALLKLRQICCDPRLLKLDAAKKVKQSAKLAHLMDMLPELLAEGRRVLLFSQFTSMLELIESELKAREITYVKLTGETRDRSRPVTAFQSGKAPLFLISLKAGGTGLNLTAADTVVHYDPWWNPAVENQATDRAHRIGQDKPVFVYKLIVAGSVEEKIAALQASKAALAAGVLGESGATAQSQLSAEDITALFEPLV